MSHVSLLGDSIFDNSAYTRGAPDVVTHLRRVLPHGWTATLCAVDGATTRSLSAQLDRVPSETSHVVVAVGGNDALENGDLLSMRVTSIAETLRIFDERLAAFETAYRAAIRPVVALRRETAVCTIYNGALEPERATIARVALSLFNDVILRTAVDLGLGLIELRSICTDGSDYANPIEPSGEGGLKIARAIALATGALGPGAMPGRLWGPAPDPTRQP